MSRRLETAPMPQPEDHVPQEEFLGWTIEASHQVGPDRLPALVSGGARKAGAFDATVYLATHEQTQLVPLGGGDAFPIGDDAAGWCFSRVEVRSEVAGDRTLLWVPLLDGTDRMGVICFELPDLSDALVQRCRQLAGLYAELVVTRNAYGDVIELRRRTQPRSVTAELLASMLPPLTHTRPEVVISCNLAPWYDVGGDAFDYAIDEGHARFAIFDGMGHGLTAALLTAVTLSAYRRARRRRMTLEETYLELSEAIHDQFGTASFVTGILCDLDLETGVLHRLNAGHPVALRIDIDNNVAELPLKERSMPFGVGGDPVTSDVQLRPGDRLVFYTDGVTDARGADGEFFGLQRLLDVIVSESQAGLPAPELLRRVALAVSDHQDGSFQDDATTMIVEWLGPQRERTVF